MYDIHSELDGQGFLPVEDHLVKFNETEGIDDLYNFCTIFYSIGILHKLYRSTPSLSVHGILDKTIF